MKARKKKSSTVDKKTCKKKEIEERSCNKNQKRKMGEVKH